MSVWLVRCGDSGKEEHKERFFTENLVAIGYGLKAPVTDFATRREVRDYADMAARRGAAGDAGKLWRFAGREDAATNPPLQIGDLVLTPYREDGARMVAVGEVSGDYRFNPQDIGVRNPHTRPVRWRNIDIPRDGLPVLSKGFLKNRWGFLRAKPEVEAELRRFLDNWNPSA